MSNKTFKFPDDVNPLHPTYDLEITKIKNGKTHDIKDTLVREIKLEVLANSKRVGYVMCTPVDQIELAVGYLMSEGIIKTPDDIEDIKLKGEGMIVDIKAKIDEDSLHRFNTEAVMISGCGRSVTANSDIDGIEAKIIENDYRLKTSLLFKEMAQFYTQCPLYEATGCVHTAKLYFDENTFFVGEDIAQHNTIDKAVGKAHLAGKDVTKAFLMVSGRLSSEMVAKAVMHQIPILASRTASTCLGTMIARKFNLTLLGFVRGNNANIYANAERIENE